MSQPVSDFAAALAASTTKKGPRCGVAVALSKLPPVQADKARAALAAPIEEYEHTQIARAFVAMGLDVKLNAVQRHRRRECACD